MALLALVLPILLGSCGDDDSTKPVIDDPTALPAATTIDILVDNFLKAYTTMDYEEYAKLLDDSYEFVFDPDDVGQENGYRERWSRSEDLESTQRMFGGAPDSKNRVAQSIRMGFVRGEPEQSPLDEEWTKVILSTFELEVEAIDVEDGETWFLRTKGGYFVDLHVKEVGGSPPLWRIVRIVDRPPQTKRDELPTEETSWGKIKSLYG
jgi:hypothetical protein